MKYTNEREMVGKPRPLFCTPGTARYSTNIHTAQAAGADTVTQITISQLLETMVTRDRSKFMPWFYLNFTETSLACAQFRVQSPVLEINK